MWSWGSCAVYDSGGYVQELGPSLEESRAQLGFLQLHNWIDNRWAPHSAPLPAPCTRRPVPTTPAARAPLESIGLSQRCPLRLLAPARALRAEAAPCLWS